ncbi:MAG: ferredoxin reductase family protein [Flavobacteriales bacterium]
MRHLKQELYFPIVVFIHFVFWGIDLYNYGGSFTETDADTMFFGMINGTWANPHRILGEVFSSWVVTVFAFNFLMATRAKWVERLFGGLDKMYLIHRRSGVIAVFLLLAHFLVVPRDIDFNPGKPLGFYAFVLIIIGVILSAAPIFKKKIPYHKWINIHKLMGLFYVLGVIHGLMVESLIKELPITRVYVFGMAFVGVAAWFYRAFLFRLFNKKLSYTVEEVNVLSDEISELILKPKDNKLKFLAGQFAFFTFPSMSKKEQHPFTISSHPYEDHLRITVKGLGDYTDSLGDKISIGEEAFVEGPYGHFSSSYIKEKEQIWIAGGIGITPFLSLSKDMYLNNLTLFWCVNTEEEALYKEELEAIAKENPKFNLVIWSSKTQGHLSLEKMKIDQPKSKGYLICGPQALKESLTKQLKSAGVSSSSIYDEEFAFR